MTSVPSSTVRTLFRSDKCPACFDNDAILYRVETQSVRYHVDVNFFDTNGENPHWDDECNYNSEEMLDVIQSEITCSNGCTSATIREALDIQAVYLSAENAAS